MKTIMFAAAALVLTGCAGIGQGDGTQNLIKDRKEMSSGSMGCRPDEIGIVGTGATTWAAQCRGKDFDCSANPTPICIHKK